jgi:hypothetical protein
MKTLAQLFQAMVAEFGKPGAAFSMKQQFVEGDYAYILWTAETAVAAMCIGNVDYSTARIHRRDAAQLQPALLRLSAVT